MRTSDPVLVALLFPVELFAIEDSYHHIIIDIDFCSSFFRSPARGV